MHPSDRGAQYASHAYRARLVEHGMTCRRRGTGDGLAKAVAARFFGSVKRARPSKRSYRPRQAARADVSDDIERFYNSWRTHSSRGYGSPKAYENIAQAA